MIVARDLLRGAAWRSAIAAVLGLAACTVSPTVGNVGGAAASTSLQFVMSPLGQAWAVPSGALVAMQRSVGADRVQLIGLANDTAMNGDNFLWLRARSGNGRGTGQFRLDDFLSRTDGVPPPFSSVSDQDLLQGTDSIGTYFYLEHRTGGQENCVLAFRRIEGAAPNLPRGVSVLEAMLRNCVVGTSQDALAPITDRQIGLSGTAGAGGAQAVAGAGRMLSPLAGPRQP